MSLMCGESFIAVVFPVLEKGVSVFSVHSGFVHSFTGTMIVDSVKNFNFLLVPNAYMFL